MGIMNVIILFQISISLWSFPFAYIQEAQEKSPSKGFTLAIKYRDEGQEFLDKNDYKSAENAFRKSISTGKHIGSAYTGLAKALVFQNKKDEAINIYRELIYSRPGKRWNSSAAADVDTRMDFVCLLAERNLWKEAVLVYEDSTKNIDFGDLPKIYNNFSTNFQDKTLLYANAKLISAIWCYFNSKGLSKSLILTSESLKILPNNAINKFYLGFFLKKSGNYNESKKIFQELSSIDDEILRKFAIREFGQMK